MEATLTHLLEMCKDQVGPRNQYLLFALINAILSIVEIYVFDPIYNLVLKRPSSWFSSLACSLDTHGGVSDITQNQPVRCVIAGTLKPSKII